MNEQPHTYSTTVNTNYTVLAQVCANTLIKWYENNYLKPNPDKWHLVLSEWGDEMEITMGEYRICRSSFEKMFGVNFDKVTFNFYVTNLCQKALKKLHALARIYRIMRI